jgi:hypothetical protein
MASFQNQDKSFEDAEERFDLQRLKADMDAICGSKITSAPWRYFKGVLCGYSTEEIAKQCNVAEKTVSVALNRSVKDCIASFCQTPEINRINWTDVPKWLVETGYGKLQEMQKPISIDWQKICRQMLDRQKSLSTNEIVASEPLQFDLTGDDIYVSLALVERKEPLRYPSNISPEQGLQQQEQPPIEYEQFQEEVLRLGKGKSRGQQIAIIGEPGAGKTTLLQKTAFWILEKQLGFPIWISLGDLGLDDNKLQRLKTYILNRWLEDAVFNVTDDVIADFERHLNGTTVWLLLDGVDEVSQSSSTLKGIADQPRGWLSESRIILSCRQNLWEMQPNTLQDFETYRVMEFTYPDKVQRFITNGFRRNNPSSGECLIAELDKPERLRLRSLVQNPLRLMLLCSAWHEGRETLPETKAGLFAIFVEEFYKWKKSRWQQETWYQRSLKTKKQREALNLALGNLAIRALDQEFDDQSSHNSFFRLSYGLVEDVLGDPEDDDTPSFFWLALQLGWLLEARKAENPRERVYAFAHPTFQEYFAASCLCTRLPNLNDDDLKRDYLNYLKWTEPIMLMLSLPEVTKEQALHIVELALEVYLMLGAKLIGTLNNPDLLERANTLIKRFSVSQELTQAIQEVANSSNFFSRESNIPDYQDPLSYKRPWTLNFVASHLNLINIQPERYTDLVSIAFKDLAENTSEILSEGGIGMSSSGFLMAESKPEWLPELAQTLKTVNTPDRVFKVIAVIQSRYGFYNYNIEQEAILQRKTDPTSTKNQNNTQFPKPDCHD